MKAVWNRINWHLILFVVSILCSAYWVYVLIGDVRPFHLVSGVSDMFWNTVYSMLFILSIFNVGLSWTNMMNGS